MQIKRALISVSNKDGIVEFARSLQSIGIDIIATGGTFKVLSDAGLQVKAVSDITKYPEMLNGRVKTLHPAIHGGILAERSSKEQMKELKDLDIMPIDLVVANLYPFQEVVKKEQADIKEAIENIDIGGHSLIRSAAKNYENVAVIVNPDQYPKIVDELKITGVISEETRYALAVDAFRHTAEYDSVINDYLKNRKDGSFPDILNLSFKKVQDLRYGENPHQKAALYKEFNTQSSAIVNAEKLNGKELSYNNVLDATAALQIVREFEQPTITVIKHTNPCSVASGSSFEEAYDKAIASDYESAFGGIIGMNGTLSIELAERIVKNFFDVIIAPDYESDALDILKSRKNLIVLKTGDVGINKPDMVVTKVDGGILLQDYDAKDIDGFKIVTKKQPATDQVESMRFAWKIIKHVKSNAIIVAKDSQTFGIGIGQTSRVNASKIALERAGGNSNGAVLASDGFFPFRDSIDLAAKNGISAIIQPGGSIRDQEIIDAANEHDIVMLFTGIRAFKH